MSIYNKLFLRALEYNTTVKKFTLEKGNHYAEDNLVDVLKNNQAIEFLRLYYCQFSDAAYIRFANALLFNTSIKRILIVNPNIHIKEKIYLWITTNKKNIQLEFRDY